jgi:cysteine desulfurase family protein (TIGR01976 family)
VVRTWEPRLDDCTLDPDALDRLLGPRTRLVAVGWASNAVGTINPVAEIVARAHAAGAWTFVDAVHAAPHLPIDVRAVETDFLTCSSYKFFGPHAGVLYGKADVLDTLPTYKLQPAHDRFETGTGNFEGLAGVAAAVEYLADVGRRYGEAPAGAARGDAVRSGMGAIRRYEMDLYGRLADGLETIPGARIHGITDRSRFAHRTPTAALTLAGHGPRAIAKALGRDGIAVWDGDFYALGLIERLGLAGRGGVVRIGLTHYNTADEIDRVVAAISRVAEGVAVG